MGKTDTQIRAITVQQPFAAALVAGVKTVENRGFAIKLPPEGEWLAIHCGANMKHLKDKAVMDRVRANWAGCPSNKELEKGAKTILGFVHFSASKLLSDPEIRSNPWAGFPCTKGYCWQASRAVACEAPPSYSPGQLQVWHVYAEGFNSPAHAKDTKSFFKNLDSKQEVKEVKSEKSGVKSHPAKQMKSEKAETKSPVKRALDVLKSEPRGGTAKKVKKEA